MADAITRARLLKVTNYRGSAIVTVTIRTVQLYDCLRPRKSLSLSLSRNSLRPYRASTIARTGPGFSYNEIK